MPRSLAALAVLLGLLCCTGCSSDEAGPSLILITIDTLRADHLSGYGYPRATSPELDRFLARGTSFRHAFSTSCRTAPSHVSLMTGLYPSFTSVDVENGTYPLDPGFRTLAEICREAGIRTAAVVSNPVLSRRLALDQGFEIYDDTFPDEVLTRSEAEKIAESTVASALRHLEQLKDRRFFLWIHFQDPHGPYTPPGRALYAAEGETVASGRSLLPGHDHSGYRSIPSYQLLDDERKLSKYVRRYDGEIRYLDEQLGRLFRAIDSHDLLERALVVLTADHGEAFGEDDFFCAHGHGLGLDQTHVPLGFVGTGIRAARVMGSAVSNIDFFATALEVLELKGDPGQSQSLLDALGNGKEPWNRVGYAESVTQRAAFGGDVYVRIDRRPLSDAEFWSSGNPYTGAPRIPLGETEISVLERGGVDADRAAAKELEKALRRFGKRADEATAALDRIRSGATPLTEEEARRLRALGYVN